MIRASSKPASAAAAKLIGKPFMRLEFERDGRVFLALGSEPTSKPAPKRRVLSCLSHGPQRAICQLKRGHGGKCFQVDEDGESVAWMAKKVGSK